ncbi:hypothetical protein FSW04_25035 [Baekduia soli]|uniref:MaoC family dehydratase n=1 Tax=Baekduia soli TaxID=496014 RepID=A0A5B8UC09_9ACTN|nr:hypothetical protein [Baekduia soli]QEC50524.1 hypothetical protein FSW04_25035 [Baekduia soli]
MSYDHLAGRPLPEGAMTVTAAGDRRFTALVGGRALEGDAVHPLWLMIALVGHLGVPIEDVYAQVGCDMATDGPMLGEVDLELHRPLRTGTYRVLGEIVDVRRTAGRSGPFDLMRMRVRLADDEGVAATCLAVQVVPRRAA